MSSATTSPTKPPSRATSPGTQAQQTINAALGRLSFESEKSSGLGSPPPPAYTDSTTHPRLNGNGLVNGDAHGDGSAVDGGEGGEGSNEGEVDGEEVVVVDPIEKLQQELERTRQEREEFASQYRNLLARLNTMRSTLGNKLKQDAEELDRREQTIQSLTAQNEDLSLTLETLKSELTLSHSESDRLSSELSEIRTLSIQQSSSDALLREHERALHDRERELRDRDVELERCRMERDEWERACLEERVLGEEARVAVEGMRREVEGGRERVGRVQEELEGEREKVANLQGVLEDFQSAKDHELRVAVKDYETQLNSVTQSLAEYKHRALQAELQLEESTTNTSRTSELEKEIKEKNLLISKLRHEAVIINEHLMEALRRLRRSSSDTNVDRRLVTNVLLSFLSTPRADPKRFEMLNLIATILSWNENERMKAGLQRATVSPSTSGLLFSKGSSGSLGSGKDVELEKTDETESFSRLWVEFLLTEANAGDRAASSTATSPTSPHQRRETSLPGTPTARGFGSPTLSPHRSGLGGGGGAGKMMFGQGSMGMGMMSTPDLVLSMPPGAASAKGKGKEGS